MDWAELVCSKAWLQALESDLVVERLDFIARQLRLRSTADSPFDHGRLVGQEEMYRFLRETFPLRLQGDRHDARPPFENALPAERAGI